MNSRIKRSLSLLLIAAAVLLLPLSCAADSTVSFDEFGFSVTFPADVIVFTRDTEPESPHWEEIGLDRDLFLTLMESSDMYADAISPDLAYEITTIIRRGENYEGLYNMNRVESDEELLESMRGGLDEAVEQTGVALENLSVYSSGELKYVYFDLTNEENGLTVYGKSYMTVVNGISVQITLRSYDGSFDGSREALLRAVVDSVQFEQIKSKPASAGLKSEIRNILTDALIGGVAGLGFYVVMKIIKRMDRKKADGGDSSADTTAASTLRCGNCGGELPQDVKFCPHCGWKIRE